MSADRITLRWSARARPLAARAVAAVGDAAIALGRRLAELEDAALAGLTAVAGVDVLIVLGEETALPWVDGVEYLGRDPAAPDVLLPTARAPSVPVAALAHALRAKAGEAAAPYALCTAGGATRLVPCGAARAVERRVLAAWLAKGAA